MPELDPYSQFDTKKDKDDDNPYDAFDQTAPVGATDVEQATAAIQRAIELSELGRQATNVAAQSPFIPESMPTPITDNMVIPSMPDISPYREPQGRPFGYEIPQAEDWEFARQTHGGAPGILGSAGRAFLAPIGNAAAQMIGAQKGRYVDPHEPLLPELMPPTEARGFMPSMRRAAAGLTTPENIGAMAAGPFAPEAILGSFISQVPEGVATGLQGLIEAKTPEEMTGATTDLGLTAAMWGLMHHGLNRTVGRNALQPKDAQFYERLRARDEAQQTRTEVSPESSSEAAGIGGRQTITSEADKVLLERGSGGKSYGFRQLRSRNVAEANHQTGEIDIDPQNFTDWVNKDLKHLSPEQKADAIRSMFEHEDIHLKTDPADGAPFWESMSSLEQWILKNQYLKGNEPESAQNMGMEAIRNRIERAMRLTRSDFVGLVGREKWTLQSLDHLSNVVYKLRQLSPKLSRRQNAILNKVQGNLEAAKVLARTRPPPTKQEELTDAEKAELQASFDEVNADVEGETTPVVNDVARMAELTTELSEGFKKGGPSPERVKAINEEMDQIRARAGKVEGDLAEMADAEAAGVAGEPPKPRVQPAPEPEGGMRTIEQIRILESDPDINIDPAKQQMLNDLKNELKWEKRRKFPGMKRKLTHDELMDMDDAKAVDLFKDLRKAGSSPQRDGVEYGLTLGPEDAPDLIQLRDQAHRDLMDKVQKGEPDGGEADMGRVVWLNGAIEGAKREGPNYERHGTSPRLLLPERIREMAGMVQRGEPIPADVIHEFNLKVPPGYELDGNVYKRTGENPAMKRKQTKEELQAKLDALRKAAAAGEEFPKLSGPKSPVVPPVHREGPSPMALRIQQELQAKMDAQKKAAAEGVEPPKLNLPGQIEFPAVPAAERVSAVEAGAFEGPSGGTSPKLIAPEIEGPVTPAKAKAFTRSYFDQARVPDFEDYKGVVQTRFGPMPEGAMRETYKTSLMESLINAPGATLSKYIRGLNLSGRFAGRGKMPGEVIPSAATKIADPLEITGELGPQLAMELDGIKGVTGKAKHLARAVKRAKDAKDLEAEYHSKLGRAVEIRNQLREVGVSDVTARGQLLDMKRRKMTASPPGAIILGEELALLRKRMDKILDPDVEARAKLLEIKEQQTRKKSGEDEGIAPRNPFEPRPPPKTKLFNKAQRRRFHIIATIYDTLAQRADVGKKSASRTEITPDDMGSQMHAEEPIYYAIRGDDLRRPDDLANRLTIDARGNEKNVSLSHRLVAFVSKDSGQVNVVDVYRDGRRGPVVMSPVGTGVHEPLEQFFKSHRPIYSIYLDEPVHNFRKTYKSVREYEEQFGLQAEQVMAGAEFSIAGQTIAASGIKPEFTPHSMRTNMARLALEEGELTAEMKGRLREDQADAVYSQILQEVGTFERPQEVIDTINSLHEVAQTRPINRMDMRAIAGFAKMFDNVRKRFPTLSDDKVMGQMAYEIYQNHFKSGDYQDFINRSLDRFGGEADLASQRSPEARAKETAQQRVAEQKSQQSAEQRASFYSSRTGLDQWLKSRQGLSPSEWAGEGLSARPQPAPSTFRPQPMPQSGARQPTVPGYRRPIPNVGGPRPAGITGQAQAIARAQAEQASQQRAQALGKQVRRSPMDKVAGQRAIEQAYRLRQEAIAEAEKENFADYQKWKTKADTEWRDERAKVLSDKPASQSGKLQRLAKLKEIRENPPLPYREWRAKKEAGRRPPSQYKSSPTGEYFKNYFRDIPKEESGKAAEEGVSPGEVEEYAPPVEGEAGENPAMKRRATEVGKSLWSRLKSPGVIDPQAIVPDFDHRIPRFPPNVNEALTRATGVERIHIFGRPWGPRANIRDVADREVVGYAVKRNMGNSLAALGGKLLKDLETKLGQPFKQTPDGEFTNVDSVKGASLYPSDVFEAWQRQVIIPENMERTNGITPAEVQKYRNSNPPDYRLTKPQEALFREFLEYLKDGHEYIEDKKAHAEAGEYRQPKLVGLGKEQVVYPFPRVALHKKGSNPLKTFGSAVRRRIGGSYKIENERLYTSERQGAATTVYEPDMVNRLVTFMSRVYKSVADADLEASGHFEGQTFAERRVSLSKEYADQLKSGEMKLEDIEDMATKGRMDKEIRVEGHPAFEGKVFPIEKGKKLIKAFEEQTHAGVRSLGQVNKALKGFELSGDLSHFFQQLLPTMINNPRAFARATHASLKALDDPNVLGRLMRDPEVKNDAISFIQHGATLAYLHDFMSGARPGEVASLIPVMRQIVHRGGQSYGTAIDVAKLSLWRSMKKNVPKEQWASLAEEIENLTLSGRMEAAGMHPGRALAERIILMAPSYYRAAIQHVAGAAEGAYRLAKGQGGQYRAKVETLKTFTTFMAGMYSLMYGAYKAAGMDSDEIQRRLTPGNSKFLRYPVKVGKRTVEMGPGGIILDLVDLTGRTLDTIQHDIKAFGGFKNNPLASWLGRKMGPIPTWVKENFFTGTDSAGRDTNLARSTIEKVVPISAATLYGTSRRQEMGAALTETGASFMGLKATTRSPASDLREIVDSHLKGSPDPKEKNIWKQHRAQQDAFVSDYRSLRDALVKGNLGKAREEYDKLVEVKGNSETTAEKMIDRAMDPRKGTITGLSKEVEAEILDRMTPSEKRIYDAAKEEKEQLYEMFQNISD